MKLTKPGPDGASQLISGVGPTMVGGRDMSARDELIRRYEGLSNDRLMDLAVSEASDLTTEALEVLNAELRARGLGELLEDVIAVQTTPVAAGELDDLVQRARRLPCPRCGSTAAMLNAATIGTARSFLVLTSYEKNVIVGCPSCISSAADKADTVTALLGWWGLPFGPIHTLQAMSLNAKAASAAKQLEPTAVFRQFVEANRGAIVLQLRAHHGSEQRGGPTRS
jgi:hypothetical protein